VLADEFDEPASAQVFLLQAGVGSGELDQVLGEMTAYGHDQAAARSQLFHQGRRNLVAPGRDHDGVKRTFLFPSLGAVGIPCHDVVDFQAVEQLAGLAVQDRVALDGVHFVGDPGQDRCLVSGAGADLQDPLRSFEFQALGHFGNDVGLGNGLAFADGQGEIPVCAVHQGFAHEQVPGHAHHGIDHQGIGDPSGNDLALHHVFAPPGEFFGLVIHAVLLTSMSGLRQADTAGVGEFAGALCRVAVQVLCRMCTRPVAGGGSWSHPLPRFTVCKGAAQLNGKNCGQVCPQTVCRFFAAPRPTDCSNRVKMGFDQPPLPATGRCSPIP